MIYAARQPHVRENENIFQRANTHRLSGYHHTNRVYQHWSTQKNSLRNLCHDLISVLWHKCKIHILAHAAFFQLQNPEVSRKNAYHKTQCYKMLLNLMAYMHNAHFSICNILLTTEFKCLNKECLPHNTMLKEYYNRQRSSGFN